MQLKVVLFHPLHSCARATMLMVVSTTQEETEWWTFVQNLIGSDNYVEAANKAGFDKSAFSRWKQGAKADPAFVVKLARAYRANVVHALVVSGLLEEEEAQLKEVRVTGNEALRDVSSSDLLREIERRLSY